MAWQPNPEGLAQVITLIKGSQSPDPQVQYNIHQQLEQLNSVPDFNNYLVYIFARLQSEPEYLRAVAGLILKNNVRVRYDVIPEEVKQHIKREILTCIGDAHLSVRRAVSSLITTFVAKCGLEGWPGLLETLVQCLDSQDYNTVEGAFNALLLLCEDYSQKLDSDQAGRPLNVLIPKFLTFFKSPHENLRKAAISCINFFIADLPAALLVNMEVYLQGVFFLAGDTSPEVRKKVCQAFVTLVEIRADYLTPYLKDVVAYMLNATQDQDEGVSLEACEFWSAIAETKYCKDVVGPYLSQLVPVLLNRMIYSDMDMALLGIEEEDSTPDNPKDVRPFIHKSRGGGGGGGGGAGDEEEEEEEDFDEDDDFEVPEWNIRKCAAAGLDILSNVFTQDMLPVLLPQLEQRLKDAGNWKIRESAILAIGAIAEGCRRSMKAHLPALVPYLVLLLGDAHPLVRSITCWTLSRYSRWIVQQKEQDKYLRPILFELLNRILDTNKKVQEAACSAFATLEEEAQTDLLPYMDQILKCLVTAYGRYQAKNLLILYDAIGTLAESVGKHLNKPEYTSILLPPLIVKWSQLEDDHKDLLPLLECLTSIATALGVGFQGSALAVYQRCLRIIENVLMKQAMGQSNPEDKEFLVSCLDLISGLTEGLQAGVESLVANSNLIALLFECMKSSRPDVCQSACALVGDLAKTCILHLKPVLNSYIPLLVKNLYPDYIAVCNNASWAIGEISIRVGDDMKPFIPIILEKLVPLINKQHLSHHPNRNILENTAITIGRLGLVCPDAVAPGLEQFVQCWCLTLRNMKDDMEKESAFRGLCKMIKVNPNGAINHFVFICDAIASWEPQHLSQELRDEFATILHGFKNSMDPQAWAAYFGNFPPQLAQTLRERYQL